MAEYRVTGVDGWDFLVEAEDEDEALNMAGDHVSETGERSVELEVELIEDDSA